MTHWLGHVLGLDDPSGWIYLSWSGWIADLTLVGAAVTFYAKHNCHRRWCLRIGKHVYDGTPYCTSHHPLEGIRTR